MILRFSATTAQRSGVDEEPVRGKRERLRPWSGTTSGKEGFGLAGKAAKPRRKDILSSLQRKLQSIACRSYRRRGFPVSALSRPVAGRGGSRYPQIDMATTFSLGGSINAIRRLCLFTVLAVVASLLLASRAVADVKLPAIFTDNLVLQRDMPVPVWGWADAGEKVTVSVAGAKQDRHARR